MFPFHAPTLLRAVQSNSSGAKTPSWKRLKRPAELRSDSQTEAASSSTNTRDAVFTSTHAVLSVHQAFGRSGKPTWLWRKTDGLVLHGKDELIRLYQQRSINHGPLSASISRASLRLTNHEVRSRNTSILRTEDEAAMMTAGGCLEISTLLKTFVSKLQVRDETLASKCSFSYVTSWLWPCSHSLPEGGFEEMWTLEEPIREETVMLDTSELTVCCWPWQQSLTKHLHSWSTNLYFQAFICTVNSKSLTHTLRHVGVRAVEELPRVLVITWLWDSLSSLLSTTYDLNENISEKIHRFYTVVIVILQAWCCSYHFWPQGSPESTK